ncbi:MAG: R2-like ligand-binding oxidase [Anaerolineales bacterium]|nr:R2-like ligand-binding oxidase [Anaerolineales bacterium]
MNRTSFTTTTRGLNRESAPMRLYEKAKRFGVWNPADIDLARDAVDWKRLTDDERRLILHLTTLFQAGEEAVTLDLLPLIEIIAAEGRLEEEMFLTTFLFEEAKHVDFFARFLEEVAGHNTDLEHFHEDNYRTVFYEALPAALGRLRTDHSPEAQIRASVTYNMIVEAVLAETGYHAYYTILDRHQILPGTRQGIVHLQQDESRHIAYGLHLLSRLVAAHPNLWDALEDQMNQLFIPAVGVIADAFASYDPIPFGLVESDFVDFAVTQFNLRIERLERAREGQLTDIT